MFYGHACCGWRLCWNKTSMHKTAPLMVFIPRCTSKCISRAIAFVYAILVSSNGITLKNTTCIKLLTLFRSVHFDPVLFVCPSQSGAQRGTHQGLQWRCQDLPGFSFKSLHLSPVVPPPLTHLILCSFPLVHLLPPLSASKATVHIGDSFHDRICQLLLSATSADWYPLKCRFLLLISFGGDFFSLGHPSY